MLTLINQVLDLSKIEAGRMTLNEKNFDVHNLLHDVEEMFVLKAEKKHLTLIFEVNSDVPQYVRTDEVKLRQVLINLLNNAMKFTEEGGVTLDCRLSIQGQSSIVNLRFSISDTGPGIAREEMDRVFEAFGQTNTGRQTQEGTGLGLPISRKFVQLMGGDIQLTSEVGRGTVFTFDIQTQVVDMADMKSRAPTRQIVALETGQPRYRILIVDDKVLNRQLLITLLTPLGIDVREAVNGQEAIDIWKTWKPHLIWMDMRMPILNGYEATKHIKSEIRNSKSEIQTVIIALTASSLEKERSETLAAGCDDFLRKPFKDAELFDLMHKHIGIQYVYENNNEEQKSEVELKPESLENLPAEWLADLRQGAEVVNVELLSAVIEQIHHRDAALADALARLVEDFKYDKILTSIQQAGEGDETFEKHS